MSAAIVFTPCASPGCPLFLPCPLHHRERERQVDRQRGSAASRGYDRRWRRLREAYLAQNPVCAICEHAPAIEVDHIEPHRGDIVKFWNFSNLQGLCKSCHSAKTAKGK